MTVGLLGLHALSPDARAGVGSTYGLGSRNAALAGATAAGGFDGFAAWTNPASLAVAPPVDAAGKSPRLAIGYGLIFMAPSFTPISNVIVENSYVSDKTTARRANVDTDYRSTIGQVIGLAYRIAPDTLNLTAGVSVFLPFDHLSHMDSGETFVPEYVQYRSRTQQPQVDAALGAQLASAWTLGLGMHVGYAVTSNATQIIQSDPASGTATSGPSQMRLQSTVKPKASPFLGTRFGSAEGASFALVIRMPLTSDNFITARSSAELVSSLPAFDVAFTGHSVLNYDPLTVSAAVAVPARTVKLLGQLDYERWSAFESPAILIDDPNLKNCDGNGGNCGIRLAGGKSPAFPTRDILIPRVGVELPTGRVTLRAGYAYRPSIFGKGLLSPGMPPDTAGNYLDPDKHMLSAGLGVGFAKFLHFDVPCTLDFHVAWHQLVTQTIRKTSGDERDSGSGDAKIGAPGYEAGGKIYGGGVSLSLAL